MDQNLKDWVLIQVLSSMNEIQIKENAFNTRL